MIRKWSKKEVKIDLSWVGRFGPLLGPKSTSLFEWLVRESAPIRSQKSTPKRGRGKYFVKNGDLGTFWDPFWTKCGIILTETIKKHKKTSKNRPKTDPKIGPKRVPHFNRKSSRKRGSKNDPKMDQKWSKKVVQIDLSYGWVDFGVPPYGRKIGRFDPQNGPKNGPKLGQVGGP